MRHSKHHIKALVAVATTIALGNGHAYARKYTAQALPAPTGATSAIPMSINKHGDIVGTSTLNGGNYCVFWHGNIVTILPTYPHDSSVRDQDYATKINDLDHFVGYAGIGGLSYYPTAQFMQDIASGAFETILPSIDTNEFGVEGFNNNDIAVGTATNWAGTIFHAVAASQGKTVILPVLPGSTDSTAEAEAINDKNQIVGRSFDALGNYETVMWENGQITDLHNTVVPMSINAVGDIAGYDFLPTEIRTQNSYMTGYLRKQGKWINFGRLAGFENIYGMELNNNGLVIGQADSTSDPKNIKYEGFLWCDGVLTELSSLVSNAPNLHELIPNSINDNDQIVCDGVLPGQLLQGFLLTPALAAAPHLNSVSPSAVRSGEQNLLLTVIGSGFENDTTLSVNGGASIPGHWLSSTQMTFSLPTEATELSGKLNISVYTPPAGGGTSNSLPVDVQSQPTLNVIAPARIDPEAVNATLTLTGTGFHSGAVVTVGDTTIVPNSLSSTNITASLPSNITSTPSVYYVRIVNSGLHTFSNAQTLTVAHATPVITSLNADRIPAGLPSFTLFVNGNGIVAGSKVSFNGGAPITPTVVRAPYQVAVAVPAELLANPGAIQVRIVNSFGDGGTSAPKALTLAARPVITSITPTAIKAGTSPAPIIVSGSHFEPGAMLIINNSIMVTPTVVWEGQIRALLPSSVSAMPGVYSVRVVNPGWNNNSNFEWILVNMKL